VPEPRLASSIPATGELMLSSEDLEFLDNLCIAA
jgi:hypothetical protein